MITPTRKIDIPHPQPKPFAQAHAGAVQEPRQQAHLALEVSEQRQNLVPSEHGRNTPGPHRPLELVEPGQPGLQHLAIEKQQGKRPAIPFLNPSV